VQSSAAVWLVIVVAVLAANLPFVSERLFVLGPGRERKPWQWRLLELAGLYALTLALGFALEGRLGQRQPQGWEFYAAFAGLFLTLAFPGFVWRHLRRHRA